MKILLAILIGCNLAAATYEGTTILFKDYGPLEIKHLKILLPFNPVIIETTVQCNAEDWPNGRLFSFQGGSLDEWCRENSISHVDVLKVENEEVLKSAQNTLKNTQIVYLKTSSRDTGKQLLKEFDFTLLSHWHEEGKGGIAVFLSRELFDGLFKFCWGIDAFQYYE